MFHSGSEFIVDDWQSKSPQWLISLHNHLPLPEPSFLSLGHPSLCYKIAQQHYSDVSSISPKLCDLCQFSKQKRFPFPLSNSVCHSIISYMWTFGVHTLFLQCMAINIF
ncbi:hypothetical protein CR513_21114, partial [Mucuna pruriens]